MKTKLIAMIGLALTTFAACSNTAKEEQASNSEQATAAQVAEEASSRASVNYPSSTLPAFKVTGMDGSAWQI